MFLDKGAWFVAKNDMNAKWPGTLGTPDSAHSVSTPCSLKYETITLLDLIYRPHKQIFFGEEYNMCWTDNYQAN